MKYKKNQKLLNNLSADFVNSPTMVTAKRTDDALYQNNLQRDSQEEKINHCEPFFKKQKKQDASIQPIFQYKQRQEDSNNLDKAQMPSDKKHRLSKTRKRFVTSPDGLQDILQNIENVEVDLILKQIQQCFNNYKAEHKGNSRIEALLCIGPDKLQKILSLFLKRYRAKETVLLAQKGSGENAIFSKNEAELPLSARGFDKKIVDFLIAVGFEPRKTISDLRQYINNRSVLNIDKKDVLLADYRHILRIKGKQGNRSKIEMEVLIEQLNTAITAETGEGMLLQWYEFLRGIDLTFQATIELFLKLPQYIQQEMFDAQYSALKDKATGQNPREIIQSILVELPATRKITQLNEISACRLKEPYEALKNRFYTLVNQPSLSTDSGKMKHEAIPSAKNLPLDQFINNYKKLVETFGNTPKAKLDTVNQALGSNSSNIGFQKTSKANLSIFAKRTKEDKSTCKNENASTSPDLTS